MGLKNEGQNDARAPPTHRESLELARKRRARLWPSGAAGAASLPVGVAMALARDLPRLRHPGRDLVRIIRPHFSGFVPCGIKPFQGERVNIHGLSQEEGWSYYMTNNTLNCTHGDLNQVLAVLGVKKFRSKKKNEKIQLLAKQ